MRYALTTATLAALVISSVAMAQAYKPINRPYPQQAYAPSDSMPSKPGEPYYARKLANGATLDPSGKLQTDRFGNVVRGDSCGANWANCAFDPNRMAQAQ